MTFATRPPGASVARRAALATASLLLASAATAGAQSLPGAAAKRAAENAVAATNAHTAAVTAPIAGPTTLPGQGVATPMQASPAPAKAPAPAPKAQAPARKPAQAPAKSAVAKAPAKAPATAAAAAKQAPATPAKGAAPAPAARDSAPRYAATAPRDPRTGGSVSVSESGAATQLTFTRETFEYAARGRRDPFVSLMKSGELRPLFTDLKLVTVLYDPTGRNSVAIMRDIMTKDQYRVKVGQTLGRMRVSQIQPKQVVFALEEFGYSRQEVLGLTDSTQARKQ